ncbi:MAG: ECF-type sigma factor [Woeseiaceae bacterium]|nr:ECF-type sigma factor [Woeseiaceae bacterium]
MLKILELEDERLARVFECRYFAGLTTAETAQALDIAPRSVERLGSQARSRMAHRFRARKRCQGGVSGLPALDMLADCITLQR